MDAARFPRVSVGGVAYDHRPRERALSAAVPLSPRALFEAIRQRESDHLHARAVPEPDRGELASVSAATEMLARAYALSFAMEGKLRRCRHAHTVGEYVPLAEHDVYAAFARYIGCVEAAGAGARSGSSSSSALAAFHRAMPVEQRDDEWHAVDAVLRARELHRYYQ
jgi:hypothetical protein